MNLQFLAKRNPHLRDAHITFDEGPHIYTIDGDSSFTSSTTWVHKHFGHFDADVIITKMMSSKRWPQSKYYSKTRQDIKDEWEKNRDEAATAGTKMHYDIECFYNNNVIINDSDEYNYFKTFESDYSHLKPYRTEWEVFDKELKIAGSIDMTYEDEDGNIVIYDWKRSKEIKKENRYQSSITPGLEHLPDTNFWHYSLQLNIYKYLLEKNYGKKVVGMFLVCLHPNNKNHSYIRLEVNHLKDEMDTIIRHRKVEINIV